MAKKLVSATFVDLSDANLWLKLQASTSSNKVGLFKTSLPGGGPLFIVAMNQTIKMVPFIRAAEELFNQTAIRESNKHRFKVAINGPTYGLTTAGLSDAFFGDDPVKPTETKQEGLIVRNKRVIGGSRSDMYYIANYTGKAFKYQNKNETNITGIGFNY